MLKKGLNKSKPVFGKCVLDLNFASIQGEVFSFLKKNFEFIIPSCVCVKHMCIYCKYLPCLPSVKCTVVRQLFACSLLHNKRIFQH